MVHRSSAAQPESAAQAGGLVQRSMRRPAKRACKSPLAGRVTGAESPLADGFSAK